MRISRFLFLSACLGAFSGCSTRTQADFDNYSLGRSRAAMATAKAYDAGAQRDLEYIRRNNELLEQEIEKLSALVKNLEEAKKDCEAKTRRLGVRPLRKK